MPAVLAACDCPLMPAHATLHSHTGQEFNSLKLDTSQALELQEVGWWATKGHGCNPQARVV
jgi:hypothetical protein